MNSSQTVNRARHSTGAILLEFLGSMNLAITLLVAIAIASVIGTVLQQNQPYQNYIIKFGPYWFEVFKSLGLYDIYGAPWFLILLGFLLVSTSVCVWRNFRPMIKEMTHFRLGAQRKSLASFHLKQEWESGKTPDESAGEVTRVMEANGYRVRSKRKEDHTTVAAINGATNRLGYLLSHTAIVVICIGGLIDGNLPLRIAELSGDIVVEKRDLPLDEIPEKSFLPKDNLSFRASVNIPEGQRSSNAFLQVRDGYLVQQLPFTIAVEDFRIEYYETGMPKSFESDLLIFDEDLQEPLSQTIAVNHPLIYKGYAIYQSSFADGGSKVDLHAWSLLDPVLDPLKLHGTINERIALVTAAGRRTVELIDFKLFNIFPIDEKEQEMLGKKHKNYGPSVVFKLRKPNGEANEYVNYMAPITMDGAAYYLTGMRGSPSEDYRYMHIPADSEGSPRRFMQFLAAAQNEERVRALAQMQIDEMGMAADDPNRKVMATSIANLVLTFVHEGMDAIVNQAGESIPQEERAKAIDSYVRIIQSILGTVYLELLEKHAVDISQDEVSQREARFFDDALNAISQLGVYDSPVFMQMVNFEHVQATGLQIAKAPGQFVVYLGFVMLMAGVFFLFYVHHRRLWVYIEQSDGGSRLLLAGSALRERDSFAPEFDKVASEMRTLTGVRE